MPEIEKKVIKEKYRFKNNFKLSTTILKVMLGISIFISIMSIQASCRQIEVVGLLMTDSLTQEQADENDGLQVGVAMIDLLVTLATWVFFFIWLYRANANCHGFGAKGMKFSPGWSVGYYFIPILNIFKPYLSMREIWKVSTNPADWPKEKGSVLIGFWWGVLLLNNLFAVVLMRAGMREIQYDYEFLSLAIAGLLASIVELPAYILAFSLVSKIYGKQEKLIISDMKILPNAPAESHDWPGIRQYSE